MLRRRCNTPTSVLTFGVGDQAESCSTRPHGPLFRVPPQTPPTRGHQQARLVHKTSSASRSSTVYTVSDPSLSTCAPSPSIQSRSRSGAGNTQTCIWDAACRAAGEEQRPVRASGSAQRRDAGHSNSNANAEQGKGEGAGKGRGRWRWGWGVRGGREQEEGEGYAF